MVNGIGEEQYYALCEGVTQATAEVSKPVWEIVRGIKVTNPKLAKQLEEGVMDLILATMDKAFESGIEFATIPLYTS